MARSEPEERTATVVVRTLNLVEQPLATIHCLQCDEPLEIHQPDAAFPERMLGTCDHCHRWYLWDFDPNSDEAVMVLLPSDAFRQGTPPAQ